MVGGQRRGAGLSQGLTPAGLPERQGLEQGWVASWPVGSTGAQGIPRRLEPQGKSVGGNGTNSSSKNIN